ncbi:pimeloyl-ACP methyl ester carboxylesterase [Virgibacillus natechei]|uniref:Pimeloyl-ACP methyl ester carboxylesterase n=1 Tax=Virgibacillus natechei TaxID=1216297 RepID=A0ABS4IDM3_9BACI|nr:alpha/beta fold hydrolase [Virgibacillus natechei]MBP1968436.1 pimeloyl-ACP methyl ester carboxylesterase [Virgibacillus natechei]UZD13559.1 lysophospholipase [Virgibacillus natechei]
MKKGVILLLLFVVMGCSDQDPEESSSLIGAWSGTIEIPEQPLMIKVEFTNDDELTGTISIPAQSVQDYPLSIVNVEEEEVMFTLEIQGQSITFDGEIEGESTIAGTFMQSGQSFPFELTKEDDEVTEAEEDGTFLEVETDLGPLYGQLETPTSEGEFPIMIIIPGSGPTDRNGNSPGVQNDSLKLLAEQLAKEGVASVRYDKRGAGENEQAVISEEEMTFDQFIEDAVAWVNMLKEDEHFTEVGIIGHSQGSLVGMLAAQESNVDTFVSLAGAGHPIDEVMYDQLSEQLPDDLLNESEEILQQLKEGNQVENVNQELQGAFRPSVQPFLSSWMKYDPAEEMEKLAIPTLIINGGRDIQVPVSEAESLYGTNVDGELVIIENMNHVLKEVPENREENLQSYVDPDLPLAEGLMAELVEFLKK